MTNLSKALLAETADAIFAAENISSENKTLRATKIVSTKSRIKAKKTIFRMLGVVHKLNLLSQ